MPRVATPASGLLALQRTVGNRAVVGLLQRTIDATEWQAKVDPYLTADIQAAVKQDPPLAQVLAVRKNAAALESSTDGKNWVQVGPLPAFFGAHTWLKKFRNTTKVGGKAATDLLSFSNPTALHSNIKETDRDIKMDVQDIEGDRHSLVHHSFSVYKTTPEPTRSGGSKKKSGPAPVPVTKVRQAEHHLTVENAHLLFLLEVADKGTSAKLDKTTLDKPAVNKTLNDRSVTSLDNLNFFPEKRQQGARDLNNRPDIPLTKLYEKEDPGTEEVNTSFSLEQYISVVRKVLNTLPNVPAVYGAKILHSVQEVQRLSGLDPAQLFMKKGKGDDRHLIRAVMTIAEKIPQSGLALPAEATRVFKRYILDKPQLPVAVPSAPAPDTAEWVAEGAVANDFKTHYNELERRYVDKYYPDIIQTLKTYIT